MSADFVFPKPSDWNAFEDIVCDVFARKYKNLNLQRYGRSGQKQSGVDIAGQIDGGILGIQCKHHPNDVIRKAEIDGEISLSEGFRPGLCEYAIVTSADRDTKIHGYILQTSEERIKQGKYPVSIKFWDDVFNWLTEYPDLMYKHFTKYFPTSELEDIKIPGIDIQNKNTLIWPFTKEELVANTGINIGNIQKIDPYHAILGITNFPDVNFRGIADIELQLTDLFSKDKSANESFVGSISVLREVRLILNDPFFSKEVIIYPQVRLTLAFMIGWMFRRVTGHRLIVKSANQIWATDGLPNISPLITDGPPIMMNQASREVVIVFNISRDITRSVIDFVGSWSDQPYGIMPVYLEGSIVKSAAHAYSLAYDLSRKLKVLVDKWGMQKIHLFTAMPAPLAILIGYNLNAICPISIYYMNETRTGYVLGGTLENNL